MVSVDSGEFPLMRNVDMGHQPNRSKVYTAWSKAFTYDVPEAVEHLADIVEDVYTYELWKDDYLDTPDQFFERYGIFGLDLDEPAKLIRALRRGDQKAINKVMLACQARSLSEQGKSTREIAKKTGLSKSVVHEQVSGSNRTGRKVDKYTISQYTKPETAAQKIRDKFGDDFSRQLKAAL